MLCLPNDNILTTSECLSLKKLSTEFMCDSSLQLFYINSKFTLHNIVIIYTTKIYHILILYFALTSHAIKILLRGNQTQILLEFQTGGFVKGKGTRQQILNLGYIVKNVMNTTSQLSCVSSIIRRLVIVLDATNYGRLRLPREYPHTLYC